MDESAKRALYIRIRRDADYTREEGYSVMVEFNPEEIAFIQEALELALGL